MAWVSRIGSGLRSVFRRRQVDRDLDEELRAYLEAAIERGQATGLTREQATRRARVEMGSVAAVKDQVRAVGWEAHAASVWQDVRYAVRTLRRAPGFTIVAVLTLALGIGANTAVFNILNALLLRTLPVADPHRLVTLSDGDSAHGGYPSPWTYATWDALRRRGDLFDSALAWGGATFAVAGAGGPTSVSGVYASGDYFGALGVKPVVGRMFAAGDDVHSGGPDGPVVVISHAYWLRELAGARTAIGAPLVIDGVPFTIIGVTPPGFSGLNVGRASDIFVPIGTEPLIRGRDSLIDDALFTRWLTVMFRLKPGQSRDEATAALRSMQPGIRADVLPTAARFPKTQQDLLKEPFVLADAATGVSDFRDRYDRTLFAALGLVGLILLVACTNLANLMLARAAARQHELAVRLAIGASRARLVRQLVVEGVVCATAGACFALLVASWGSRTLAAQLPDHMLLDLAIDWRAVGFTTVAALGTVLLSSGVPAFRAVRDTAPILALRGATCAGDLVRRGPWRRRGITTSTALMGVQIMVSLVLVIAAGLLVASFQRMANVPTGFDPERVLVLGIDALHVPIRPEQRVAFYERLADDVAGVPGVAAAAASLAMPLGNEPFFEVVGSRADALPPMGPGRTAKVNFITPHWFAAEGIPVLRGRDLTDGDRSSSQPVMIVNEAFVRRFYADRDPLGETFTVAAGGGQLPMGSKTIVGVVADTVAGSLRGGMPPMVYVPLSQWNFPVPMFSRVSISVRPRVGFPADMAAPVVSALKAIEPTLSVSARVAADQVDASMAQERMIARLASALGGIALLLAWLGVYGVTSYAVARRRSEMGVRIALGATRSEIVRLVLARTGAMVVAGLLAGLAVASMVTRYLAGLLFGIKPLDPSTFAVVSSMFVVIATLAALVPAWRSATIDPLVALREE
jgi:predicted permease